jgi:hypothetical protein
MPILSPLTEQITKSRSIVRIGIKVNTLVLLHSLLSFLSIFLALNSSTAAGWDSRDRGEHLLNVFFLEYVGEERGPDRFDVFDAGGFDEGL